MNVTYSTVSISQRYRVFGSLQINASHRPEQNTAAANTSHRLAQRHQAHQVVSTSARFVTSRFHNASFCGAMLQKRISQRPATISTLRAWATTTAAQSELKDITRRKVLWREIRTTANLDQPAGCNLRGTPDTVTQLFRSTYRLMNSMSRAPLVLLIPVASLDSDSTVTSQNVLLFFRPHRMGIVRANSQKREHAFQ